MDPSIAGTTARQLPATNALPTTAGGSGASGTPATPRIEAERPTDRESIVRGESAFHRVIEG